MDGKSIYPGSRLGYILTVICAVDPIPLQTPYDIAIFQVIEIQIPESQLRVCYVSWERTSLRSQIIGHQQLGHWLRTLRACRSKLP
jgi:hypothetical protein